MPAIAKLSGLDQLQRAIGRVEKVAAEAHNAGEDAAAEIFRRALEAAAPEGASHHLEQSIIVVEQRDRKALIRPQRQLLVGPSKKRGFYGFFLEWGTSKMAARPWFRPAVDAVMGEAQQAYENAFSAYMRAHGGAR